MWSLDTIVQMRPAASDGASDIIMAVDAFSKWVELGTRTRLDSTNITRWFHANIICRYKLPGLIRTHSGAEYKGKFWAYMREAGIRHQVISARNPRANGQVEHFNQMIKMNLSKFAIGSPAGKWWEFLANIARGLRLLPVKALGYAPHILV